ncbi:361_t:CDS:2, partial [Funneliformis caledonium]
PGDRLGVGECSQMSNRPATSVEQHSRKAYAFHKPDDEHRPGGSGDRLGVGKCCPGSKKFLLACFSKEILLQIGATMISTFQQQKDRLMESARGIADRVKNNRSERKLFLDLQDTYEYNRE